ncbi:MAG: bifunctional serine/threonine-protein kinase/formylglycine-generating enzyme family protein [Cyanobacteria bacterium P01_F01_bin.150]
MAWTPGQRLQEGNYRIKKVLGVGGFGITYLATSQDYGEVVIKTLNDEVQIRSDFDSFQDDFMNEALRIRGCQHPHIVKVHCFFTEKVCHPNPGNTLSKYLRLTCMVMECIDGVDLAEMVSTKGRLTEANALRYIQQVGQALSVVHGQGLLHRDIKPNNIMVRQETDKAVLIDFGIAREFTPSLTRRHTPFLTDGYAPVEQYQPHAKRGAFTDVYALAATLYSLVTGEVPPLSLSRRVSLAESRPDDLVPPQEKNVAISDRVNAAIMKGMAIQPEYRPQSMAEWLQLLERSPSAGPTNDRGDITNRYPVTVDGFTENLSNGVTFTMVQIPGGDFTMGSPPDEAQRGNDEGPQHLVSVPSFFMGMVTVTQAVYEAVMGKNPSNFQGSVGEASQDENRPVKQVAWNDAIAFCKALNKDYSLIGQNYRLPSEAEWEYACRAGTTTPFHFGATLTSAIANHDGSGTYGNAPKGKDQNKTTPVGSFPPNAFGLYDMHGNVWEWCEDRWHDNYDNAPSDGSSWTTGDTTLRGMRGGAWLEIPRFCRSANRHRLDAGLRYYALGFRLVCSSPRTI